MSKHSEQDEIRSAAISAMDNDQLAFEVAEIVSRCVDAGELGVDPDYELLLIAEVQKRLKEGLSAALRRAGATPERLALFQLAWFQESDSRSDLPEILELLEDDNPQ